MAPEQLLTELHTARTGLSQADAKRRLQQVGPNSINAANQSTTFGLLLSQFKSPLVLILVFAAIVSAIAGEWPDALIVIAIVMGSTTLGFWQEYRASDAIEKLRSEVTIKSNDLFVSQAVLTGEVFPVEKKPDKVPANASLMERVNCVFMGTSVRSGTATVLIVQTAKATVFGQIAERLKLRPAETEFERGVHRFGFLLTRVMFVMFVAVLAVNIILPNLRWTLCCLPLLSPLG